MRFYLYDVLSIESAAQRAELESGLSSYYHASEVHILFYPILFFGDLHHPWYKKLNSEDGL